MCNTYFATAVLVHKMIHGVRDVKIRICKQTLHLKNNKDMAGATDAANLFNLKTISP